MYSKDSWSRYGPIHYSLSLPHSHTVEWSSNSWRQVPSPGGTFSFLQLKILRELSFPGICYFSKFEAHKYLFRIPSFLLALFKSTPLAGLSVKN